MKYFSILLLTFFIALNGIAQYDLKEFKKVDSSLNKSIELLSRFDSIKRLSPEESKAYIAWEKLDGYINGLKAELKQYKEDDLKFPNHLFFERNEGKKLHVMLKQLQQLATDNQPDSIVTQIKDLLNLNIKGKKSWWDSYFKDLPVVAAITMLSKVQNDMVNCVRLFWR